MGATVLLVPFIIPFFCYAFIKLMLDPSFVSETFNLFFSAEAFEGYKDIISYILGPEFVETVKSSFAEIIEYYSGNFPFMG